MKGRNKVNYLENQVNLILNWAKQREKQFSPELKHNEILISEISNIT